MNLCSVVTADGVSEDSELTSNQEEADTKLIFHACVVLKRHPYKNIIIRNTSGDVDIIVIALGVIFKSLNQIFFDTNKGNYRKLFKLSEVGLSKEQKLAIVGFQSFTGNYFLSSFFQKGKLTSWKLLEKHHIFLQTFARLGENLTTSESLINSLEEFVCLLYGSSRYKKVNDLRFHLFRMKYENNNKIIDLSLLPPCRDVLVLHIMRAAYVANVWRNSDVGCQQLQLIEYNGWNRSGEIRWIEVEKAFPTDIASLLATEVVEDEEFAQIDEDSEDEECLLGNLEE